MKKLVCDLCEKELDVRDCYDEDGYSQYVNVEIRNSRKYHAEYDICNECYEKILKYAKEKIKSGELVVRSEERTQIEWIPIKTRPMNDEEKKKANEYFGVPYEEFEWPDAWHYDCRLPEVKDDECVDVLVTTKEGYVVVTSYSKDCFGSSSFENVEYPDDITAWAYMPKPYKEEGESDADS